MKVYETTSLRPQCSPPMGSAHRAITIGNFDGCHVGHQKLIAVTKSLGTDMTPTSLSFSPHPSEVVGKISANQPRLFTPSQKMRAFEELGLKESIIQKFDLNFAEYSPTDFLTEYLKHSLSARAVIVGDNFCFGKDRKGDVNWLAKAGADNDIQVRIVAPEEVDSSPVSSSRIKTELRAGRVERVSALLGRPYLLEGDLHSDQKIGRKIGSPTLNLKSINQILPKIGVYAGWISIRKNDKISTRPITKLDHDLMPAAINIGTRPTIDASNATIHIEAHAIDRQLSFDMDSTTNIGLYFAGQIRAQRTFESIDALRVQISADVVKARRILNI